MKLVMMGTGPFARPTFQRLVADGGHEMLCLITRPDKPSSGRRKRPPANPMRELAVEMGVEVFAPESINAAEGLELLDRLSADLFVVCDYGQILSSTALAKSRLGGINLHGSLLPKYRGAAPINWALLNGESTVGITVILMTPRLDGGPMLTQRSLPVAADDDAVELEAKMSELGVPAVVESLQMLISWDGVAPIGRAQDPNQVTKAPRLQKSDGEVDWALSAARIANQVRALKPWPGTYTRLQRGPKEPMRVILEGVEPRQENLNKTPGHGTVVDGELLVQCGTGCLHIRRLQPAGKRSMEAGEFVRGYGADVRFVGPS